MRQDRHASFSRHALGFTHKIITMMPSSHDVLVVIWFIKVLPTLLEQQHVGRADIKMSIVANDYSTHKNKLLFG